MQKSIESVLNEGTDVQETKDELNQLIGEGKNHVTRRKELVEDKHYYGIASTLLKDSGIKSKIIKHYLPIMNKLINKYLADMDFFCQFNLDENFNETIKSLLTTVSVKVNDCVLTCRCFLHGERLHG